MSIDFFLPIYAYEVHGIFFSPIVIKFEIKILVHHDILYPIKSASIIDLPRRNPIAFK